ncbi:hypothetical protein GPALN_013153 [Globodera pallida]|nr:hypothetical protein GPALN_013153 [Globodera pallida]
MRSQLTKTGVNFDWDREIYMQTGIFSMDSMDFSSTLQAWINEQVDENGCSWRSGAPVKKRRLRQWAVDTPRYAKIPAPNNGQPCVDGDEQFDLRLADPAQLGGAQFVVISKEHSLAREVAKRTKLADGEPFTILENLCEDFQALVDSAIGRGVHFCLYCMFFFGYIFFGYGLPQRTPFVCLMGTQYAVLCSRMGPICTFCEPLCSSTECILSNRWPSTCTPFTNNKTNGIKLLHNDLMPTKRLPFDPAAVVREAERHAGAVDLLVNKAARVCRAHSTNCLTMPLSVNCALISLAQGYSAYSPSKFALRGFADALHMELLPWNVGVSILTPKHSHRLVPRGIARNDATNPCHLRHRRTMGPFRHYHWSVEGWMLGVLSASTAPEPGCLRSFLQFVWHPLHCEPEFHFAGRPFRGVYLLYGGHFNRLVQNCHERGEAAGDMDT